MKTIDASRATSIVDGIEELPDVMQGYADPWHNERISQDDAHQRLYDAVDALTDVIGEETVAGLHGRRPVEAIFDYADEGNASGLPSLYAALRDHVEPEGREAFDEAMADRGVEVGSAPAEVLLYGRPTDRVERFTLEQASNSLMAANDFYYEMNGDTGSLTSAIPGQLASIDALYVKPFGATSTNDATDDQVRAVNRGGYAHKVQDPDAYKAMVSDPHKVEAVREVDRIASDVLPLDEFVRYAADVLADGRGNLDGSVDEAYRDAPGESLDRLLEGATRRVQSTIEGAGVMEESPEMIQSLVDGDGVVAAWSSDPQELIEGSAAELSRARDAAREISARLESPAATLFCDRALEGPLADAPDDGPDMAYGRPIIAGAPTDDEDAGEYSDEYDG